MSVVKISIPGKWWDSVIYAGRLYLFARDGSIVTITWDQLIENWDVGDRLALAMDVAFRRSDYLYRADAARLLQDADVREVMRGKFSELSRRELVASTAMIRESEVASQDNPFPFPHADCTAYMKSLWVGGRSGIYRGTCGAGLRYPVSSRPERRWDGPVAAMAASYGSVALASGPDGLFEMPAKIATVVGGTGEPSSVCPTPCSDCDYTFASIFASSHTGGGYLARFSQPEWRRDRQPDQALREVDEVVPDTSIFAGAGYSWGTRDKLCQAAPGGIRVVKFRPRGDDTFNDLGFVELAPWKGGIITAKTALFGVVVECDNAIVILPSTGEPPITLEGEPINWRVFPRSKHYENHLHVVRDECVDIYSLNHDYFVDQSSKVLGLEKTIWAA